MRVGIIGLLHESNTFINTKTTIAQFKSDLLLTGNEVRRRLENAHHEIGGFFQALDQLGVEAVPIFVARAYPSGVITADAFDELMDRLLDALEDAGALDGVLAAPHGATVAENHPDADGFWLSRVRSALGPDRPLIATIDPHANVSPQMVTAADALLAYRTNPHLDQRETGRHAAQLIARTLRGEVHPVQAAALPPMAINIRCQATHDPPLRDLLQAVDVICAGEKVLSHNVVPGFPYADVCEMGSSVIVVTDDDPETAKRLAETAARTMWRMRRQFDPEPVEIEAAMKQLRASENRTLVLDMGDNVGGGSPGDGTLLAHALQENGIRPALVCLCDPDAVQAARQAGVSANVFLEMGGKTDTLHGPPLRASCQVLGLYSGRFREMHSTHGGFQEFDQGESAVVRTEHGLTVLLTSRRVPPFSLQQIRSCGLDPTQFRVIVAKGVIAPLAAYGPVCDAVIHVDTPGVTCADMRKLNYRNRRQPMFPFESEMPEEISIVTICRS